MKKPFKEVTSPVMTCTSPTEAKKLLKAWKKVLGLSDWNIVLFLVDSLNDGDLGESRVSYINKSGTISISTHKQEEGKTFLECFEETLVHELLHFKLPAQTIIKCNDDMHNYFYEVEHQALESLAHGYICAKYNLPPKWDWTKEI